MVTPQFIAGLLFGIFSATVFKLLEVPRLAQQHEVWLWSVIAILALAGLIIVFAWHYYSSRFDRDLRTARCAASEREKQRVRDDARKIRGLLASPIGWIFNPKSVEVISDPSDVIPEWDTLPEEVRLPFEQNSEGLVTATIGRDPNYKERLQFRWWQFKQTVRNRWRRLRGKETEGWG